MNDRIAAIAAALGVALDAEQVAALAEYLALLQRWNGTYNLTALRDPAEMLTHHLADCLAVLPLLLQHRSAGRLLDVGSGGGLPGVVIAVAAKGWDVTCCDTVGKKAAFVRQVAAALRLGSLHAEHARVENLRSAPFDVITSRAFASLADFCRWTRPLLAEGGVWMAMKGKMPDDEIAALPAHIDVFHVEHLQVPDLPAERCLVWMQPKLR